MSSTAPNVLDNHRINTSPPGRLCHFRQRHKFLVEHQHIEHQVTFHSTLMQIADDLGKFQGIKVLGSGAGH